MSGYKTKLRDRVAHSLSTYILRRVASIDYLIFLDKVNHLGIREYERRLRAENTNQKGDGRG